MSKLPSPIDAALNNGNPLPACGSCMATKGDPCRTKGDRPRFPHDSRIKVAMIDGVPIPTTPAWQEWAERRNITLRERSK